MMRTGGCLVPVPRGNLMRSGSMRLTRPPPHEGQAQGPHIHSSLPSVPTGLRFHTFPCHYYSLITPEQRIEQRLFARRGFGLREFLAQLQETQQHGEVAAGGLFSLTWLHLLKVVVL